MQDAGDANKANVSVFTELSVDMFLQSSVCIRDFGGKKHFNDISCSDMSFLGDIIMSNKLP